MCADVIVQWTCPETYNIYVLLIKRKHNPFKYWWALPGGYVNEGETTKQAAYRELKEETGVKPHFLDFMLLADKPDRDSRGWTISVVYRWDSFTEKPKVKVEDDAVDFDWFNIENLPSLAFDHLDILNYWFHNRDSYYISENNKCD